MEQGIDAIQRSYAAFKVLADRVEIIDTEQGNRLLEKGQPRFQSHELHLRNLLES
ncbi:hypothetical protein ACKFKG_25550 [Phormidesmis sp. 146-35]